MLTARDWRGGACISEGIVRMFFELERSQGVEILVVENDIEQ